MQLLFGQSNTKICVRERQTMDLYQRSPVYRGLLLLINNITRINMKTIRFAKRLVFLTDFKFKFKYIRRYLLPSLYSCYRRRHCSALANLLR